MHVGHDAGGGGARRVRVVRDALAANDRIARENRETFARADVAVVNLMSAPGAGKTALLESLAGVLRGVRLGVLEGDIHGRLDADRLGRLGIPVAQIETGTGFGGECHLEARMVRAALAELPLAALDLLVVENVGNLVCPAEFEVGEDLRVMVCAVTEGEDKPLKYPLMFRASDLVLVNKIDLLPQLELDFERLLANIEAVHPGVPCLPVSARTGEGVEAWREWLEVRCGRARHRRLPV